MRDLTGPMVMCLAGGLLASAVCFGEPLPGEDLISTETTETLTHDVCDDALAGSAMSPDLQLSQDLGEIFSSSEALSEFSATLLSIGSAFMRFLEEPLHVAEIEVGLEADAANMGEPTPETHF